MTTSDMIDNRDIELDQDVKGGWERGGRRIVSEDVDSSQLQAGLTEAEPLDTFRIRRERVILVNQSVWSPQSGLNGSSGGIRKVGRTGSIDHGHTWKAICLALVVFGPGGR